MLEQSTERSIEYMKKRAYEIIDSTPMYQYKGSVSKLLGLTVEVKLPGLKIGDLCFIETWQGEKNPRKLLHLKVIQHSFSCSMTVPESVREALFLQPVLR